MTCVAHAYGFPASGARFCPVCEGELSAVRTREERRGRFVLRRKKRAPTMEEAFGEESEDAAFNAALDEAAFAVFEVGIGREVA